MHLVGEVGKSNLYLKVGVWFWGNVIAVLYALVALCRVKSLTVRITQSNEEQIWTEPKLVAACKNPPAYNSLLP